MATKAKTTKIATKQKTAVELQRSLTADEALSLVTKPRGKMNRKGAPARRSLTENERKAISDKMKPLRTRAQVPQNKAMDELHIKIKGNTVTPIDECVSSLVAGGERLYNAPTSFVHIPEYVDELSKLGDTRDTMEEFYKNTTKGKEILAAIESAKDVNPFLLPKYKRQMTKGVDLLLATRKLIAKRTEAELNGFIINVQPGSPHVEVLSTWGQERGNYTLDNFQECEFVGARSFADLKKAPASRAKKGSKKKAGSQAGAGTNQGQQNVDDKTPTVPVAFAAIPNTLAMLATSIAKTDDAAIAKVSVEDKAKQAVSLVTIVSETFRDLAKSPELRQYASDIVVELWGLLNVASIDDARKIATKVPTEPVKNKTA